MGAMTDERPNLPPGSAYFRLAGLGAGVALAVAAVGYVPAERLAGAGAGVAWAGGVGLALLATCAGLVPPVLSLRLPAAQRVSGTFAGMLVRFVVLLALLLATLLSGLPQRAPLALGAALGYVVLLAVETAALVRLSAVGESR